VTTGRRTATALIILSVIGAACSGDGREMSPPSPDQTQSIALPTVAPSVSNFDIVSAGVVDGRLEDRHTCFGPAVSPPIEFVGVAGDIVTLGVVMVDGVGEPIWAMANIQPTDAVIAEGAVPTGAIRATVGDDALGYAAPCPETGQVISYRLMGYALAQQVELPDGVDADTLTEMLEAAALDIAVVDVTASGP
jgi:phosphatidylethanolamine-binding protein (PEBP) family uncharacterized protein